MTEQPNGLTDEDVRDDEVGTRTDVEAETDLPEDAQLAGAEPEGAVSDTTAIKEAGEIGRPASTMRA